MIEKMNESRFIITVFDYYNIHSPSTIIIILVVAIYGTVLLSTVLLSSTISIGTKLTRARGFLTIINTRWPHSWENGMLSYYLHTTTHTNDWLIWFTTTHTTIKQYPLSFSLHQNRLQEWQEENRANHPSRKPFNNLSPRQENPWSINQPCRENICN